MRNCAKFEDLLGRFLHGGVLLQEREELEGHLAVCSSCEHLYRDITEADRALRELPGKLEEPPPYLRAKIMASLPEAAPGLFGRQWGAWATALGGVAACALLAIVLLRPSATPPVRVASAPPSRDASAPAQTSPAPGVSRAVPSRSARPPVAAVPKVQVIREVKIYFYCPPAKTVAVTGDFNGWDPQGVPLVAAGKPGLWETKLRLKPGAYTYNFIVDGDVLVPDPNSSGQMPDGYGGTNSILLVNGRDSG